MILRFLYFILIYFFDFLNFDHFFSNSLFYDFMIFLLSIIASYLFYIFNKSIIFVLYSSILSIIFVLYRSFTIQ